MFRRRGAVLAGAVAVCTVAALASAVSTGSASASPGPSTAGVDPRVTSLASDEHLSIAQATERIDWQDAGAALLPGIVRHLGKRYGGAWFDTRTGELVIGATAAGSSFHADALPGVATSVLRSHLRVATVRWADAELSRVTAVLSRDIASVNGGGTVGISLRTLPPDNLVELKVGTGELTDRQRQFVGTAEHQFGSRVRVTRVATSNLSVLDSCSGNNCDPPLRGGVRISSPKSGCTLGYIVRSNVDDKLFALTAGHCVQDAGIGTNWSGYFANGGTHTIGGGHNYALGGPSDSGIIAINNPAPAPQGWGPRAQILVLSSSWTTYDQSYAVSGTGGSMMSMLVCKTGAYYGTDCGTVTGLNATDTLGYTGLGEANYRGGHGDSGGPIYAGHRAYGIHHSHWPPNTAVSTDSYYVGITKATADLRVRVAIGS